MTVTMTDVQKAIARRLGMSQSAHQKAVTKQQEHQDQKKHQALHGQMLQDSQQLASQMQQHLSNVYGRGLQQEIAQHQQIQHESIPFGPIAEQRRQVKVEFVISDEEYKRLQSGDLAVLVSFKDKTIRVVSDDWTCEHCGLVNPPDADGCNDCDRPRDSAW